MEAIISRLRTGLPRFLADTISVFFAITGHTPEETGLLPVLIQSWVLRKQLNALTKETIA